MDKYSKTELTDALQIISSSISKCEEILPKFTAGSAQNTLLKNRLQAMYISKALVLEEKVGSKYSKEDLEHALRPIDSIIHKCKAGQSKHPAESSIYKRLQKLVDAMIISRTLIEKEISERATNNSNGAPN